MRTPVRSEMYTFPRQPADLLPVHESSGGSILAVPAGFTADMIRRKVDRCREPVLSKNRPGSFSKIVITIVKGQRNEPTRQRAAGRLQVLRPALIHRDGTIAVTVQIGDLATKLIRFDTIWL